MKKYWILTALLPICVFAKESQDDFLYIADDDLTLLHIDFDAEEDYNEQLSDSADALQSKTYQDPSLSLLEIDENHSSLLPWSDEKLGEEATSYVERRANQIAEEYDDVFANEPFSSRRGAEYQPTYERVPKEQRQFFVKPKVVPSKEDEYSEQPNKRKSKRPPIAKKGEKGKQLVIKGPDQPAAE